MAKPLARHARKPQHIARVHIYDPHRNYPSCWQLALDRVEHKPRPHKSDGDARYGYGMLSWPAPYPGGR